MAKNRRSFLRRVSRLLGVLVGLLLVVAGVLFYALMKVHTQRLDERCYALLGGGGNTLLLTSDEGALVVDTKFGWPASQLEGEVRRITGKPVKMVVDTHYHLDHTHGNARFTGAEFVGHSRTRDHLVTLDAANFGPVSDGAHAVPTTLVDDSRQLQFGDDYVDIRYLGVGHTDGDVVVFLHKRSLLHTGDLFLNGYYPPVDTKGGGSMRQLGPTLDKVIAIGAGRVIPGHGPIGTTADVARFREYVRVLWEHVLAGVRAGKSKVEILRTLDVARFHLSPIPALSSLEKNVDQAYDEAVALVKSEPAAPAK